MLPPQLGGEGGAEEKGGTVGATAAAVHTSMYLHQG